MRVAKARIPEESVLYPSCSTYSYTDSYEGMVTDEHNRASIEAFGRLFLKPGPKWVDWLFVLRNRIVSVFGLKTPSNRMDADSLNKLEFEPGKQAGLFRVFSIAENEIVLGEDDKHLKFRVSLFLDGGKSNQQQKVVTVTTAVVFNSWFGRLYFIPVKPFHKLIVRTGLKSSLKQLEAEVAAYN